MRRPAVAPLGAARSTRGWPKSTTIVALQSTLPIFSSSSASFIYSALRRSLAPHAPPGRVPCYGSKGAENQFPVPLYPGSHDHPLWFCSDTYCQSQGCFHRSICKSWHAQLWARQLQDSHTGSHQHRQNPRTFVQSDQFREQLPVASATIDIIFFFFQARWIDAPVIFSFDVCLEFFGSPLILYPKHTILSLRWCYLDKLPSLCLCWHCRRKPRLLFCHRAKRHRDDVL